MLRVVGGFLDQVSYLAEESFRFRELHLFLKNFSDLRRDTEWISAHRLATKCMGVPIYSFCVHKTWYFTQKLATEWMTRPIHSFCGTKMSRRSSIAMIPRLRGRYRGLFSDGSRSHPKSSCWRTGNNPIPNPLPHPFQQLPKNKHIEVVLGSAGKQPVLQRSFPRPRPGENFAISACLATEWMARPFHSFCGTKMSLTQTQLSRIRRPCPGGLCRAYWPNPWKEIVPRICSRTSEAISRGGGSNP